MKINFINTAYFREYEGDSFCCWIRFESKKSTSEKKEIESFLLKNKIEANFIEWQKNTQLCLDFSDMMLWVQHNGWENFCNILESGLKSLDEIHAVFAVIYLEDEYADLDNEELAKISRIGNSNG